MADIFVSYAREDRAFAERIARGLGAMGLDVFWDTEIPPGQTWADYIEGKLTQCRAVIVLWSQHSTKSQWVREEARMGREKAKLIPVMLDGSPAPFGFGEVQAADLSAWTGDTSHPDWVRFAQAAYRTARGGDAPPPPVTQQPQAAWSAPPAASGWNDPRPTGAHVSSAAETLSPIGYFMKCLRLYVDGRGRARRAELGWFFVFAFVIGFAAAILDIAIFGLNPYTNLANSNAVTLIAGLLLICPTVAVAARRAHDFGQSGWLAALTVIPYLGWLIAIIFIFIPGQPGENQYGPNPKGQ